MKVKNVPFAALLFLVTWLGPGEVRAWDYEGHHVINELALASLPTNFPAFVSTAPSRERIAFLGGEPDRWRNTSDLSLQQDNAPDHYIDLEELKGYELTPEALPLLRYDFVGELAVFRAAHADRFPAPDPSADRAHTRNLVGFLPWTVAEYTARLRSAFSYLKAYQTAGGTQAELENAQANVIYLMGVMGHFVGDASQPLHTTVHFNGWVGDNPAGYTSSHAFHAWIDGGYFRATGGLDSHALASKIHPAGSVGNPTQPDAVFRAAVSYLVEQNKLVEPLYQLEKEGKLSGEGQKGLAGRAFLEEQLVKGAQMLGDLWNTAWMGAPEDKFLEHQLALRQAQNSAKEKK